MDYLPIVVKKGRPFLEGLSKPGVKQRAICPRGKLLSFVNESGHLEVLLLSDDEQRVLIDSTVFVGCQWVLPSRTNQDCVVDQKQQQKSELFVVSSDLDFYWFSVCENEQQQLEEGKVVEEGGLQDGGRSETLTIERLAFLKKKDLCTELRKQECANVIDSVSILGSDSGQILLLFNSNLVVMVTLDKEFSRIIVNESFVIETSLKPYDREFLPERVAPLINFVFSSPLLFAMTKEGLIFIYHIHTFLCIGIVSTTGYCHCACGRQPDSEELLTAIIASEFKHLAVSSDLNYLVVSTRDSNLLLVNLPEYFQVFPKHYHPEFTRSSRKRQSHSVFSPTKSSTMEQEEAEDRKLYGGLFDPHSSDRFVGAYTGQYACMNRIGHLQSTVNGCNLSDGQHIDFQHSSSLLAPNIVVEEFMKKATSSLREDSKTASLEAKNVAESQKQWYEEPITQTSMNINFSSRGKFAVLFITGMQKPVTEMQPSGLQSNLEGLSPSRYYYKNHCILPTAVPLFKADSTVIQLQFASGMIVAYLACKETDEFPTEPGPFANLGPHVPITGLAVYHTGPQSYSVARLQNPSWLVSCTPAGHLVYLTNQQTLGIATFNLSQEEFVGKVLMYGSASIAEEICHINRWDNCSLPINALETALELRQLDTLAFFLRSREGDAKESDVQQQRDEPTDVPYLPPLPPDQLETVVQLLITAIRKNYQEESFNQFASQLLIMTLGFLTRMIKSQALLEEHVELRQMSPEVEETGGGTTLRSPRKRTASGTSADTVTTLPEITVSSNDLTSYVHQLRSFLPKSALINQKGSENDKTTWSSGDDVDAALEFMDKTLVERWDKLSTKEVIKDALLYSQLPVAQAYLIQRGPEDTGRTKMGGRSYGGIEHGVSLVDALDDYPHSQRFSLIPHYGACLKNMLNTAIGFVVEALERRSLKLAINILTQIGLNVRSSLRHICFHTLNRSLRDFLAKELTLQKWLSDHELQALDYLHILETYYPHQSYDQAHNMHPKEQSSKLLFQSTALPVMPGIVSRLTPIPTVGDLQEIYPETFGGDYPLSRDTSRTPLSPQSSSSLYLQVPLVAVLQWDSSTRQRILFEGFLLNGMASGVDCERLVHNKEYIFNYYIAHNDITKAIQFVTSEVPPLENPTHCPSNVLSLCSRMPRATTYLHNTLLDELARHGVFLHSELFKLPALLHVLGRVHSLFSHPHPLSKTSGHVQPIVEEEDDEVTETEKSDKALVSLEAFHRGFLQYLIANRFFSLLYHYLDEYGLGLDEVSISFLGLDSTDQPWVEVLLQYRRAALNPLDSNVMFQASLSCSHLLLSSGTNGGGRRHVTVMDMLQSGRTLMALATLLLAPVPLEEAMDSVNKHQPWYVEPVALKVAVAAYPSLQAAVFPPPPTTLTPAQSQDITVYDLLQGSVPFNVSRLFKWQETNSLASAMEETVGSSYDLPHFSAPALIDKSGLAEHLNYVYYLRRGQPSFAFANFVAAKLLGHSNSVKRIDRAMARVYRLTMLDFTNSKLSSSSAAFIEMLDRDSTLLRVDTQVALRIAKHGSGERSRGGKEDEGSDQYRKLASQFIQLFQNPENIAAANSLLLQLETATHNLVSSNGVEVCGLEAEDYFELVQSFCHCHQLPPSIAFLVTCAKHGEWLPLLCHAQRYTISPQKVMMIVEKHFSSPCIQEHLRLAISSMDVREYPSSPTSQAGGVFPGGRQKGKRKRTGSSTRARVRRAETLVRTQRDHRAKYYSRVGLQRETTPQPEVKPSTPQVEEGEEVVEVEVTEEPSRVSTSTAEPPARERETMFAIEETDLPDDLFSVFFKCQSYETPWRALLAHAIALQRPLLAVLAACKETPEEDDTMMVDCMCVWLYATLGYKVLEKATTLLAIKCDGEPSEDSIRFNADLQWRYWSPFDLSLILMSAMQSTPSPAAALSLAFKYFDSDNPLLKFLLFHEEFVLRRNFDDCKKCLNEFALAVDKALNFSYQFIVGDITWVSQVASAMASHMLVMCATPFERSHLLQLLSETNFGEKLQCSVLNFRNLHQMSVVLSKAGLASDAAFTVKEHISSMPGLKSLPEIYSVRVRVDTDYVLGLLLEKGQFDIAKKYAGIVESTASQVTIKEVEHNLRKISNSSYWQYEQARLNFWHQCNSSFQTAKVDPESAAEFFESIVHSSSEDQTETHDGEGQQLASSSGITCSAMERALLLAFALKWRKETETLTNDQLREFEKEIWLSHIHSAIEQMEGSSTARLGSSPLPYLPEVQQSSSVLSMYSRQSSLLSSLTISAAQEYKERRHLGDLLLPDNVSVALEGKNRRTLSEKEAEAFDMLLGRLMNAGLLSQAREVAALFEHDSPDLTIVLCCIQLAQGKLTPEQLTEGVLSLVSTRPPRHLSDSSYSFEDSGQGRPSAEIIRMMSKLSDRAKYAQQCCDCIMTCFRLALALKVPYAQVITSEPSETLTLLLSSSMPDKYSLASKFVSTCNLEPKQVAGFLSDCVVSTLQSYHGTGDPRDSPKTRIFIPQMTSKQFMELAQLCPDHTLLGNNLLSTAKSLSTTEQPTTTNLIIQVELLIRAHDCFTLGCCVDGIAEVLTVSQQWVKERLIGGKHFKLMVRLLTGIGRFHEMSYIIRILLKYDEFESLVHTGVEKEEQLRVALMEYLKRYHTGDTEKCQMVALKFGMFRELAKAQEEQAKRDMKKIRPKLLVANNPETVKNLKNVFDGFRAAAKTYSQEDCLSSAEHCYSKARLVALQLSVLQQGKQVINLDAKRVRKFMEEQPFSEALIVSDAYKQGVWADWISPLYKKVVISGEFKYLNDFKTAFPLTPNMFQELASKYLHDREKPPDATANIKRLLTYLKNLPLKRKIAMELGLTDVMQSISATFDEGFLNDVARL